MTGTPIHERLYALAAFSDPDPAAELTACADAARDMLAALRGLTAWDAASWAQGVNGDTDYAGLDRAMDAARAAVAKAEGRADG